MSAKQDTRRRPIIRLSALGLSAASVGAVLVLSRMPERLESFVTGTSAPAARRLGALSAKAPFSIAEVLAVLAVLAVPLFLVLLVRSLGGGRDESGRKRRSFFGTLLTGLTLAGVAVGAFALLFGAAYQRRPLEERLGWSAPAPGAPDEATDELKGLCEELVDLANKAYQAATGKEDLGEPTAPADLAALDAGLEEGFAQVGNALGLPPGFATRRPPVKTLKLSPLVSYLGLSGFYMPFTGEANVNAEIPGHELPLTIAHEKGHQRMVAPENEASFVGYLACVLSEDPFAQYSAFLYAQRRLLGELSTRDPEAVAALVKKRLPGVQRDVDAARAFWESKRGAASRVASSVNDAYLKSNQVEDGVGSYRRSAELLIRYARARGGTFR